VIDKHECLFFGARVALFNLNYPCLDDDFV